MSGSAPARGEFVAFLAADCRAAPGWVAARLAAHRRGYDAVAGVVAPERPANRVAWAAHFLLFPSRLEGARAQEVAFPDDRVHGLSYARALLARIGPFREDLRIGEDTEMARSLRDAGVAAWVAPAAVITHRGPSRAGPFLSELYRRGVRSAKFAGAPPRRALGRTRVLAGSVRGSWTQLLSVPAAHPGAHPEPRGPPRSGHPVDGRRIDRLRGRTGPRAHRWIAAAGRRARELDPEVARLGPSEDAAQKSPSTSRMRPASS